MSALLNRSMERLVPALRASSDLARELVLGAPGAYRWMLGRLGVNDVLEDRRYRFLTRFGPIHYFSREDRYLVTGFEEADHVLKHDEVFRNIRQTQLDPYDHIIYARGDRHEKNSSLIRACISKDILNGLNGWVGDLSTRIFDSLPVDEKFDWYRRFCMPTVFYSTCHILGFDHDESVAFFSRGCGDVESSEFYVGFKGWCLDCLDAGHEAGDGRMLNTFRRYVDEGLFTSDEASELLLLMFAGALKTTSSLLAVISRALMDRRSGVEPSELLEEQVLTRYVEESLRLNPIVPRLVRKVVSDTSVSGFQMKKGSSVYIDVRAANRDPKRFEKPDVASYSFSHPRHLTFGAGIHHCIGMYMARHQLKVVLPTLIERMGSVRHIASEWTTEADEHHFYHPRYLICRRSKAR